jgi:hypothetical protein
VEDDLWMRVFTIEWSTSRSLTGLSFHDAVMEFRGGTLIYAGLCSVLPDHFFPNS